MKERKRTRFREKTYAKRFERLDWGPDLRERKTLTDYLATALRTAIYDGQFADNEELNQVELAEHFNVSRVPIREALRQLQAEGLVENVAHHRTIVTGMTTAQILEAIEMRAVLEAHLLQKAAKRFSATDLERLRDICKETDKIKDYGPRWVVKNWEFHRALYGRADSPGIVTTVEQIHLKIERYARQTGSSDRLRKASDEHRQILRAIENGDFNRAAALLEEHILHTGEVVRQQRDKSDLAAKSESAAPSRRKSRRLNP
jgi:DNA-binding GntR family transcriptional regulator